MVNPDDAVNVGDLVFHHGCLTCVICGDNMEGRQVTLDSENKIYCSSDYERFVVRFCLISTMILLFCLGISVPNVPFARNPLLR